jgi:hypothetical protein
MFTLKKRAYFLHGNSKFCDVIVKPQLCYFSAVSVPQRKNM